MSSALCSASSVSGRSIGHCFFEAQKGASLKSARAFSAVTYGLIRHLSSCVTKANIGGKLMSVTTLVVLLVNETAVHDYFLIIFSDQPRNKGVS